MTNLKKIELKAKLDRYCREYLQCEEEKQEYFKKSVEKKDFSDTVITTLKLKQDYINVVVKRILGLVDRLNRNDVEFDNELAVEIYNYFKKRV